MTQSLHAHRTAILHGYHTFHMDYNQYANTVFLFHGCTASLLMQICVGTVLKKLSYFDILEDSLMKFLPDCKMKIQEDKAALY